MRRGSMPENESSLTPAQRQQLEEAANRLHREFEGVFSMETIGRYLHDSLARLAGGASYLGFVPLLAERFARERLRASAKVSGLITTERPTVLFLCVHNAGRSQMAAAWLSHLAGDAVEVLSGGSEPTSQINPDVVLAMKEVGIDVASQYPKPWTDETVGSADVIVTMGCGDACPVLPGKRYLDWELDDPSGRSLEDIRPIRDEIERRVRRLMTELGVAPSE
jgi:protein-tyrosine-phosphatase